MKPIKKKQPIYENMDVMSFRLTTINPLRTKNNQRKEKIVEMTTSCYSKCILQ